jgi:hypothetical protein
MLHPFEAIPARWRRRILIPLTLAALLLAGWLAWANAALMNPAAPAGLWSLALARDGYGAREIIDAWEMLRPAPPRVDTAEGIVQQYPPSPVDAAIEAAQARFWLIPLYALALSLACAWTGQAAGMRLAGLGYSLAAWLAALLHAAENTAVLRMLLTREPGGGEAALASACFVARWALLALILAWLGRAWRRARGGSAGTK